MSKDTIIEKIIADATAEASQILSEARIKADAVLADANAQIESDKEKAKNDVLVQTEAIKARSKTVAELDARRHLLGVKAELVDLTFKTALDKILNLDKKSYTALIKAMLDSATDGDTVIISNREKGIVTAKLVAEIAKSKQIELTLSKEIGSHTGGIILSNNGIDKNLSLDVEFATLKDEIETQIAKELLG